MGRFAIYLLMLLLVAALAYGVVRFSRVPIAPRPQPQPLPNPPAPKALPSPPGPWEPVSDLQGDHTVISLQRRLDGGTYQTQRWGTIHSHDSDFDAKFADMYGKALEHANTLNATGPTE
jgi:hypothetical protein